MLIAAVAFLLALPGALDQATAFLARTRRIDYRVASVSSNGSTGKFTGFAVHVLNTGRLPVIISGARSGLSGEWYYIGGDASGRQFPIQLAPGEEISLPAFVSQMGIDADAIDGVGFQIDHPHSRLRLEPGETTSEAVEVVAAIKSRVAG